MGFLIAFVRFVAAEAVAHPEIASSLASGIVGAVEAHEQHPEPGSPAAIAALRAGIAAAASSAATALLAKQNKPATQAPAPATNTNLP